MENAVACATCEHNNSPGSRFCNSCGSPLAAQVEATDPQTVEERGGGGIVHRRDREDFRGGETLSRGLDVLRERLHVIAAVGAKLTSKRSGTNAPGRLRPLVAAASAKVRRTFIESSLSRSARRRGADAVRRLPPLLTTASAKLKRTATESRLPRAVVSRAREVVGDSPFGGPREITSITIEHGFIKLLVSRGQEVLRYRTALATPRFFREGLVSDAARVAEILHINLEDMGGKHRRIIGAVPGYQSTMGRLELPKSRGMDPKVIIPREASRTMGISPEVSYVTWRQLPDYVDRARWLVLSAARRSMTSLSQTVEMAGLRMATLELRQFALARAVNESDAVIAWTALDGCDVVIVQDYVPVAYQSAYWGAEPVEGTVLVDRLTAILEQTIAVYEAQNLDSPLTEGTPLYVSGSPIGLEPSVGIQVAANLQRPIEEVRPPLKYPPDFPVHDLIVNVGLALWEAA